MTADPMAEVWAAIGRLTRAVVHLRADLEVRVQMAAGLDPRSSRYSTDRRTLRGAIRYELRRKAHRTANRVPAVRNARRFGKTARRLRRNPAAGVAAAIIRYPLSALRTAFNVLLLLVLLLSLLWFAVGAPVADALGKVIPSMYAASCSPTTRPVGGVVGASWEVGNRARRVGAWEPDPAQIRAVMFDAVGSAGTAVGWVQRAAAGAAKPTTTVDPAMYQQTTADCVARCGTGSAPVSAAAGGSGVEAMAAAAVAAGLAGDEAATFVAITGPESRFGADPRNPTSSARGPMQILLSAHPSVTEAQALDPVFAFRYAKKIKDASPRGFAGPWEQTFGAGLHEQHMPAARAAVAAAELRSGGSAADRAQAVAVAQTEQCARQVMTGAVAAGESFEGRYENGRIPLAELAPLSVGSGQMLRADAAAGFEGLAVAYRDYFGASMCITDSYRDYDSQVALRAAKPRLAAVAGTSKHGWGVALDLCGGAERFGTPQYEWLLANGHLFGWVSPDWAREGGSKPEAWHVEFVGTSTVLA